MKYAVLDIETTGLDARHDEILEIGIVLVADGQVLDTFHRFIQPSRPIPAEIVALTGITEEMLADGAILETGLAAATDFLQDTPIVAHNAQFDMNFLNESCYRTGISPSFEDALCTLKLSQILFPTLASYRLEELAKSFDLRSNQAHRALDDALLCSHLLEMMAKRTQALPLLLLQQLTQLASHWSVSLERWFSSFQTEVGLKYGDVVPNQCEARSGLVYTARAAESGESAPMNSREVSDDSVADESQQTIAKRARDMLAASGPLSQQLPQYEAREGQIAMVEAVGNSFESGHYAAIEAGTGTGKSMAYLVPAALFAKSEQGRVVVSTHTLALQDQLEQRDFPTLQNIFDGNLRLAVQKGRKNYVCLRKVKAESTLAVDGANSFDYQMAMSVLVWLIDTRDGMRDELSTKSVSYAFWSRIQSETDSCINKRCPFFRPCYYFRAKANAQNADIVVTNHSLLLSDLKADHRVLPPYDTLVVDEAHHLAEQATKHLGGEVNSVQLGALALRLSRDAGKGGILAELLSRYGQAQSMPVAMEERIAKAQEWIEVIRTRADDAFSCLATLVPAGQTELRLTSKVTALPQFDQFSTIVEELRAPIVLLRNLVQGLTEWSKRAATDEEAGRVVDAAGFLESWLEGIEMLEEMTMPSEDKVTWIERKLGFRPRTSVHTAPVDVSSTLHDTLFEPLHSAVLTSATLSIRGKFDFMLNEVGLNSFEQDGRLLTANVQSSFDYSKQARLCVPNDVPELAKMSPTEAAVWLADSLYQLALVSKGRLLALFTSHQMLRETAKILRQPLRDAGLALFAQEVDGTRTAMLEAFRNRPESVLLGAQSFWEGIDLPGDQLTTLVIVRLPFSPPSHPVTEARHEKLSKAGKSPFWASSLPDAVVRFRQGFGRLIRTTTDKGVVVVYDKRIVTQRYGQTFIQSLAGVRPYVGTEEDVLQHIQSFLA